MTDFTEVEMQVLTEAFRSLNAWAARLPESSPWREGFEAIADEVAACFPEPPLPQCAAA